MKNKGLKLFVDRIILCQILFFFSIEAISQNGVFRDTYHINNKQVYFKNKDSVFVYKKGWTITEKVGGKTITRILGENETDTVEVYEATNIGIWRANAIKHSDDNPGKLFLSPLWFVDDEKEAKYGSTCYIAIPENRSVVLRNTYWKLSAITIPFSVRPELNDSTGTRVTTDLKLGASISKNVNWEIFRNKRIKAQKSAYGVSFGLGFGLGKVSLNRTNTNIYYATRMEEFKKEEDGLALFIAPGIGFNIRGFQAVLFRGYDFAITNNVKTWNYNRKGYWGIGLGVDLSTLAKL